jgi:uncharacterized protein
MNHHLTLAELKTWETQWQSLLFKNHIHSPNDPAHDLLHFKRVATLAKKLASQEGGQLEVVIPAAWLHDWINFPKNDPRRSQASQLSSEAVQNLLIEMNYPSHWIPAIGHAIEAHSFSADRETRTLEAKIVQDADRLDALGAIGIARCFATAGIMGSSFYSADDIMAKNREPDDRRYAIDHFFKKLFKISNTLKTEAGRREAERRIQLMNEFLKHLQEECSPDEI